MTGPFTEAPEYGGRATAALGGLTLTARCEHDPHMGAPWDEHDGHGPVSDWRWPNYTGHPTKAPGERPLHRDLHGAVRFYDFAEACRIARRDGWGVPFYRTDTEHGANGLLRVSAQYFRGHSLETYVSAWSDDINDAYRDVYAQLRATFPSDRAYAAAAAEADFARLKAWCEDDWYWVAVIVTAYKGGVKLGSASLWGIESDAGDYLREVANELADEAVSEAKAKLEELCECA